VPEHHLFSYDTNAPIIGEEASWVFGLYLLWCEIHKKSNWIRSI